MPLKLKYSLIAAFLVAVWCLHIYDKEKGIESAKTSLIAEYNKKLLSASQAALTKQTQMQQEANKGQEQKDAKIKDIDARLSVALNELRKRPKRTENNPQSSTASEACTGASLYSEDGEFLEREAARADRILTERDFYYEQYESVRRRMEEASN